MSTNHLYQLLNSPVNSTRKNRAKMALVVLNDKELFLPLLQIVFKVDDPISIKAAWVLEFIIKEELNLLYPHLNYFSNNLSKVYLESAVRPTTKICEIIAKKYTSKNNDTIKKYLNHTLIISILEVCFDRLISEHKVAVKVYAMETLFLLGRHTNWVHDELKLILEQNMHTGSAAYKARGKRTLARITKLERNNSISRS